MAAKISFAPPPKSRVLVFDWQGSEILANTALKGIPHFVLHSRREVLYLAPSVLLRMPGWLGRIDWGLIGRRRGRGLFGQLYKVYLLACVEAVDPAVVVTWIDNSWLFQQISRAYPKAEFYAMQNGSRSLGCVTSNLELADPAGYVVSMPNLLCFGRSDEELYKSNGHRVDRFHVVGPMLGGYYRSVVPLPTAAPRWDLCLVSQWGTEIMGGFKEVRDSVNTVADYVGRYVRERGLKVCVAPRSSEPAERAFYRERLGADVTIIERDAEVPARSTYAAIDDSAVVVGFCSTVLLEAFGWGKKALFCNVYRHRESYAPRSGPWSVEEPRYELFREKLDALRAMSQAEYEAVQKDFARYAVNYDPAAPAHLYLRGLVERALAKPL